jgi:drug/metabolite transporter (DMT)-like permease
MTDERRALLQIHFCVVLWGFTAILGKLISLPAAHLVWWRMFLVAAAVMCIPRVWRAVRSMPSQRIAIYAGIGLVVALHWLTFYGSIKLSNASVAATCMALAPVVMALIEPVITGARFRPSNLLLGLLVVPGVALVVGGIPAHMHAGFWMGAVSAALTAVFGALNKRYIGSSDALAVTGIEIAAGFVLVAALTPWLTTGSAAWAQPNTRDFALLVVLALACTLLPFALSLVALRHVSAFTAQLALNLEPVYAVAVAALFLGEARELDALFYLGVAIVLGTVFGHAWLTQRSMPQPGV